MVYNLETKIQFKRYTTNIPTTRKPPTTFEGDELLRVDVGTPVRVEQHATRRLPRVVHRTCLIGGERGR